MWKRVFGTYQRYIWVNSHYHILYYTKNKKKQGKNQENTVNKVLIPQPNEELMYHYPEDVLTHLV